MVKVLNFNPSLGSQVIGDTKSFRFKVEVPCQKPGTWCHGQALESKVKHSFSALERHGMRLALRITIHHCAYSPRCGNMECSKLDAACLI
jgi:hypothetical protein